MWQLFLSLLFAHLLISEDTDGHHNLISSLLQAPIPIHKMSWQSVYNVWSNGACKQTDKQTNTTKNIINLLCQGCNNTILYHQANH